MLKIDVYKRQIVMYVAKFTDWIGQIGVRPIWICPLVGLVLGDLQAGIILGASLELVFIGAIDVYKRQH